MESTPDALYQKAILNVVWGRQFIPEADLQRIADTLATAHSIPITPVGDTIGLLNPNMNRLGFEIRSGISEDDGSKYYGLCNFRADPGSQLATNFKPVELQFFRAVIGVIMTNKPSGSAKLGNVLQARMADEKAKLDAPDANNLITALVKERWLSVPEEGTVSLGPRGLLELRQYIEGEYAEHITECTVCSDLVFRGESCLNAVCTIKLHHHCARTWFHGKVRKCPTCTNPWPAAPAGWEDNEPLPQPRQFHPNAVAVDE